MQVCYITPNCAEGQSAQLICNFVSILASVRTQMKVILPNLSTVRHSTHVVTNLFPLSPLSSFVSLSLFLVPFSQGST